MDAEYNELLQKAETLKKEIVELERHIGASEQFQGEDLYEMLIGLTEEILRQKQEELMLVIFQLKEKGYLQ